MLHAGDIANLNQEDDTTSNTDLTKRQRLTPVPGDHGNSEMSHISNTVIQSSTRANIGITNNDQVSLLLKRVNIDDFRVKRRMLIYLRPPI